MSDTTVEERVESARDYRAALPSAFVPDLVLAECTDCGRAGILYPAPSPGAFLCPACTPHLRRLERLCWRITDRRRAKLGLGPLRGGIVDPGPSWYALLAVPIRSVREIAERFRNGDGVVQ